MNAEQATLYQRIEAFDLDEPGAEFTFTQRLARENGWSLAEARRAVAEYKKFAFLAVAAGHPVTPSEVVDQVWHLHLTYTRSYWERFCPDALGTPLHHNPTTGGKAEKAKFADWYARTRASYAWLFGQEPPADIWPEASARFTEDRQQWVNTARNWIVPKPSLAGLLAVAAVVLVLALWLFGPGSGWAAAATVAAPTKTAPAQVSFAGHICTLIFAGGILLLVLSAPFLRRSQEITQDGGSGGSCGACSGCGGGCGGCGG